eukprot:1952854-Amphidinium_carterae.1
MDKATLTNARFLALLFGWSTDIVCHHWQIFRQRDYRALGYFVGFNCAGLPTAIHQVWQQVLEAA